MFVRTVKKLKNIGAHCGAISAVALSAPALTLAAVPAPPTPSGSPATNDAISWFKGVFEDASEVAILAVGVLLFLIGAVGMVWAVVQVLNNKAEVSEVAKIGIASAGGIAFGIYALTQATAII